MATPEKNCNGSSNLTITRLSIISAFVLFFANQCNAFGFPCNPRLSRSIKLSNDNLIALAAKKTKKKKRPAGGGGGGFGAAASKSPMEEKQEEDVSKKRATASHILIKDDEKAKAMLEDIKVEVADDPDRFAHYASQYSECGSRTNGGSLGEFGVGKMAKEFEQVVFSEEVGKVHGPIKTQFGYHLIYISERTDPNNKMDKYFKSLL